MNLSEITRDVECLATQQESTIAPKTIESDTVCESEAMARAVRREVREQIEREERTIAMYPEGYLLSKMSEEEIDRRFRRGKETMSGEDVLEYFEEKRRRHLAQVELDGNTGIDECQANAETRRSLIVVKSTEKKSLVVGLRSGALQAKERFCQAFPTWLDFSRPDTSREKKRFPLSAFAAVFAVAVSLMLIVASTVMVTLAENNVSMLKREISDTSAELAKLRSDFEVQNDLLEIRRIATEEYGMVDESYVKMEYITVSPEDSVEVFEKDEDKTMGLAAILSAIGIK